MSLIAINTLPVELWNIVLTFTPHSDAKHFIYIALLYKSFTIRELEELKKKYIYDYIISMNPLHKCIYKIYTTINTINTHNKYLKEFNSVYQIVTTIVYDKNNTMYFKNFLVDKITNKKHRQKFNNLTKQIASIDGQHTILPNTYYINMFHYL